MFYMPPKKHLLKINNMYNSCSYRIKIQEIGTPRHRKFDRNTVPWEIGTA